MKGIWKSMALALGAVVCGCVPQGADLIATNGASPYVIVHADGLSAPDRFVINDFNALLAKALGEPLKVVPQSAAPAAKRIFYGIAPEGFDRTGLADQERCTVVQGGDVYLFGGGVNGSRYAVYDFLQNVLGYRFFDARGGMTVPAKSAFSLKPMVRRSQFAFALRQISWSGRQNGPEAALFLFRHGFNGNGIEAFFEREGLGRTNVVADLRTDSPGDATLERVWLPVCDRESRWKYVHKYGMNLKKEHPEYFGKHPDGTPDFSLQYCFSEPGARAEVKRRVLDRLAELPPNSVVDISAGDHDGPFCRCAKCEALCKKYDSPGGPLYDWFLEVCPEVQAKFPDKFLMTLAYRKSQTQRPPSGIDKMPDNFIPDFAPIDDDFSKDWNHESNLETKRDLEGWGKLCKHVRMWYYPNPYQARVTPPIGNIGRLVSDIRIMHAAGTDQIGFEHNVGVYDMTGFTGLQTYVMMRLFDDVTLDAAQLIREYLDFTYGAAAPGMQAYLDELERKTKAMSATNLRWNPRISSYHYLTGENFLKWSRDFDRMETLLADDPLRLENLRRVRINLDLALLDLYFKARKEAPAIDSVEQITARIQLATEAVCKAAFAPKRKWAADNFRKFVQNQLAIGKIMAKADATTLPKELFGQVPPEKLFVTVPRAVGRGYLDDHDAAFGIAACYENVAKPERMLKPFLPYLYDEDRRKPDWGVGGETMQGPKPGSRGKFVFYRMAPVTLKRNCFICFGHDTGHDIMGDLGAAFEEGSFNRATVWLSLKFEGEHYYPEDAGKPNRIYCDRIVVVRD